MDKLTTNLDCGCYTLQSVDSKPIMVIHDPVVTIGLVAVLLLICTGFALTIYVRRRGPHMPQEGEQ